MSTRLVTANLGRRPHGLHDWLAKSRVRQVMYHATSALVDFESFDTSKGDLGAHFGTLPQANHIASHRLSASDAVRIIPVWLRIMNPLRLKDVGSFHADGIALQLEKKGLLAKGEGKRIAWETDTNWRLRKIYDPRLRNLILAAGYDGVVYANTQEGLGDSYIVFDPDQIRFALSPRGSMQQLTQAPEPELLLQERCRA